MLNLDNERTMTQMLAVNMLFDNVLSSPSQSPLFGVRGTTKLDDVLHHQAEILKQALCQFLPWKINSAKSFILFPEKSFWDTVSLGSFSVYFCKRFHSGDHCVLFHGRYFEKP